MEKYKLKNKQTGTKAILTVKRFKNGNVKSWYIWTIYNGERGIFLASEKTEILSLICLFNSYEVIEQLAL